MYACLISRKVNRKIKQLCPKSPEFKSGAVVITDELNANLVKCANLRGVENLQHRVLADFAWFVDSIIHHRWDVNPYPQYQCLQKYYDRCQWNDTDALIQWSRLFLEYYEECAEEWTKGI